MLNYLRISSKLLPRYVVSSLPNTSHHHLICRSYCKMERAVVRCLPGESKLTISFVLEGNQKHMLRDQSEELGKVLARIANSLIKGQGKAKKAKRNKGQPAEVTALTVVRLSYNGDFVADDAPNADAWQDGSVLHVGECKYTVERNAPTFTMAELPASVLAGFPVCAKLEVEFGHMKDCQFTWYKEERCSGEAQGSSWVVKGNDRIYVPSNDDIGRRLKLKCTPRDGVKRGVAKELVSAGAVEAGPGACTFDNRHVYTVKQTDERTTRVVSYNILADVYAQTELSKTVLYPYCAPYALGLDYRQSLLKKELAGYNADILCLQEVDKAVFADSLRPALDAFGMDGVFRAKERQHEGLATFYRRSRLRLLSQHDVTLATTLASEPLHASLLEALSAQPCLRDQVLQRATALQVSVLQYLDQPARTLCVANTHLHWHPKGGTVRLVQGAVALRHLRQVISDVAPDSALLFCGDFNSTPSSGLFQLLTGGCVPESHPDWASSGPERACPMELLCPFSLLSACGEPAYTNYVGGFHGCLDYVFLEPTRMQVEQVIPLPSHEEVITYQALPSVAHPSDHIALVCDLTWK